MVSAGVDNQIKVWDIRMMKPLHAYFSYSPARNLDISQRGLLAVGYGRKVQVWRDALSSKQQAPYMSHVVTNGVIEDLAFCPFEDGHEPKMLKIFTLLFLSQRRQDNSIGPMSDAPNCSIQRFLQGIKPATHRSVP